jgi:hypothetical protein
MKITPTMPPAATMARDVGLVEVARLGIQGLHAGVGATTAA